MPTQMIGSFPFAGELSAHADAVERDGVAWAQRFGLIHSDRERARFQANRFARLAARVYPHGDKEATSLAADWLAWLFLFDDLCDERDLGRDPERLRERTHSLIAAHGGGDPRPHDPFEAALSDLGRRYRKRAGQASWERICRSVEQYFASLAWEAENRAHARAPSVADYVTMRPLTGAMMIVVDIADVTDAIDLAAHARSGPLEALTSSACYVVCWTNDIVSAAKESGAGDVHNLVLATCAEQQVELAEAIALAHEQLHAELERYVALEAEFVAVAPSDGSVGRYLNMLRAWMRGYADWISETCRYGDLP